MRILLFQNSPVETFGCYLNELESQGVQTQIIRLYAGEDLPDTLNWSAVIVGGTPVAAASLEQDPSLGQQIPFLRSLVSSQVPVFGVCCGGQVLAMILGGSVERLRSMEIGCVPLNLTDNGRTNPLFAGFPEHFPAFEWHADVFQPPSGAQIPIEGGAWHAQAFQVELNVGILFHLEYDIQDITRWVNAYEDELDTTGLDRSSLLDACERSVDEMQRLGRRMISNYVGLLRTCRH